VTICEVAAALQCSEAAVVQRIEDGESLAVSIGGDNLLVSKRRIDRIAELERVKRPSHLPARRR
jgi:hypothetical protein